MEYLVLVYDHAGGDSGTADLPTAQVNWCADELAVCELVEEFLSIHPEVQGDSLSEWVQVLRVGEGNMLNVCDYI